MRSAVCFLVLASAGFAQRNEKLHELFNQYNEDFLRENPTIATSRGRNDYDDRWKDWSPAGLERRTSQMQRYLDQLQPFLKENLSDSDRLSARLLQYRIERNLDTEVLDTYILRLGVSSSAFHNAVFITIDLMPRGSVRDYQNIIRRIDAVPEYVNQNIAILDDAISRGIVQPTVVVDRVISQLRAQGSQSSEAAELLAAFRRWPAGIPETERRKLTAQATAAYKDRFLPAWRKLRDFLETRYAPSARTSIALGSLPNGGRLYQAMVRSMTTTALTAEQIHELGKQEVVRIEDEMLKVVHEAGFSGSLHEYQRKLVNSPDQHFRSKDEMLVYCRNIAKIVEPELPRQFRHIPGLLYGIRAIPPAREASTATNAQRGAPDLSRPGWLNLNTFEPGKQVKYDKEALVLHEAVPGHLFQLAIALELRDLPDFRKGMGGEAAYSEGWALYAESLGSDLGVYLDSASRFGRLDSERFRAVRLVVDTGMHALGWSRAQAVEYFTQHAPTQSLAEIDRYISMPAQALSYKMGQLKILELRRRAEKELGPKFDIRDFHDVVLRNGALPLEMVEETVDAYIRQKLAQ